MSDPKKSAPPAPADKTSDHEEELIDEAEDESFPASDPNSETQPRVIKH